MLMFSGEIQATFDEKGRVVLPADYKNLMGGSVPGGQLAIEIDKHEKCLNIYTVEEWQKRVMKFRSKLNLNNKDHSKMLDGILRRCRLIAVPENCRFTLPANFIEFAGITKNVVFTGQIERLRLWDAKIYQSYVESLSDTDDSYKQKFGSEELD
jgi:MraZ protein